MTFVLSSLGCLPSGEALLSAVVGRQSVAGSGCRLLRRPAPEARPFPRRLQKTGACWEPGQASCSFTSGALWVYPFQEWKRLKGRLTGRRVDFRAEATLAPAARPRLHRAGPLDRRAGQLKKMGREKWGEAPRDQR